MRAACSFEGIVRQAIHDLKYRYARSRAPILAALLERAMSNRPMAADIVVPVPLAARRRRERGFNQAELIAAEFARCRGLPFYSEVLCKVRDTPPQVGLAASARRVNLNGAFECTQPDAVTDRFILVVDDVATTGATMFACAEPLKAAGARRVVGLVVARDV